MALVILDIKRNNGPLSSLLMIGTILFATMLFANLAEINAQDFPEPTGFVVDQADILTEQEEAQLSQKLEALKTQSNREFAVATINDLQGYDIADYGYQLGRAWGVGNEGEDDGIVLIIAPNERKMRIEVGYGLEGIITDGLSGQIIRQDIIPQFKAGDMFAGINAGVDAIGSQLLLPPEEAALLAQQAAREARNDKKSGRIWNLIFWLFIIFIVILPMLRRARGERHYDNSGLPIVIWGSGLNSDYIGDSRFGNKSSGGFGGGGFGGGGFGGFGGGGFGGGGASGGW